MADTRNYWFKAKSSGLGWSIPLTWQGWVVYAAMFGSIAYFAVFGKNVGEKILGVWIPILVCLPVIWAFGEPLSGRKKSEDR